MRIGVIGRSRLLLVNAMKLPTPDSFLKALNTILSTPERSPTFTMLLDPPTGVNSSPAGRRGIRHQTFVIGIVQTFAVQIAQAPDVIAGQTGKE